MTHAYASETVFDIGVAIARNCADPAPDQSSRAEAWQRRRKHAAQKLLNDMDRCVLIGHPHISHTTTNVTNNGSPCVDKLDKMLHHVPLTQQAGGSASKSRCALPNHDIS